MTATLPTKLSELLRLAVKDAQACELDPAVELNMYQWHFPQDEGPCLVCMAGAVMHCTLGTDPEEMLTPHDAAAWRTSLLAIDRLRTGGLRQAALWLDIVVDDYTHALFGAIVGGDFDADAGRASWETYIRAAQYLEEQGL